MRWNFGNSRGTYISLDEFEMIAGKSVVAFRREETDETHSAKCFGFVKTYDEKPRRRLWEVLKSQGMQENQQERMAAFMSTAASQGQHREHRLDVGQTSHQGHAVLCLLNGEGRPALADPASGHGIIRICSNAR